MKVSFFNFSRLLEKDNHSLVLDLKRCLGHGRFILGPEVSEFEEIFAKKTGSKHCVGVSNGTDALLAILMSLDLPSGSEVIVPAFTFVASASTITRAGLKPVFVDIEKDSFKTSLRLIRDKCTENTSAIIFVHLFGEYTDLDSLSKFCKESKVHLIEDCAQSYGAPNGKFGIASSFSFFPAKNLGCLGDGGAIITDDKNLRDKLRWVRAHGNSGSYKYELLGGNFRLDAIQAAFLKTLIISADEWVDKRRYNANYYIENLSEIKDIILPKKTKHHSFNQFTIRAKDRGLLREYLKSKNIESNIYYPHPLYNSDIFDSKELLEETEDRCKEVLSLPIYSELRKDELDYVIKNIKEFYKKNAVKEDGL